MKFLSVSIGRQTPVGSAAPDTAETSAAGSARAIPSDHARHQAAAHRTGGRESGDRSPSDDTSGIDRAVELDASVRAVGAERDDIRSGSCPVEEIGALIATARG